MGTAGSGPARPMPWCPIRPTLGVKTCSQRLRCGLCEDLFPTVAVWPVLRGLIPATPGLIFWPCLAEFPCGTPDAVHVWHKSVPIHPRSVTGNVAGHQYERILSYGCGAKCEVFRVAAIMPNFAACSDELTPHPTQKPLALLAQLMGRVKGDTVLDPFCGSGTTLIAALETGRKAIGIEIDERWVDVAVKRLERWHAQGRLDFGTANAGLHRTSGAQHNEKG